MNKMLDILSTRESALGYSGSLFYFITEHYELISGMLLSLVMVISSIALQLYKVQSIKNAERRKEERHQQEMQQDQEFHHKNMQDHADEDSK